MEPKVCNTCGRELPRTSQYFYKFIHSKDGFKSSCKECQGGNFIVKETIPDGSRRCSTCKKILKATEENFLKYWSERDAKYYLKGHCLECGKAKCKDWREKNREHYLTYARDWGKSDKGKAAGKRYNENHKVLVKAYKRKYRQLNVNKIREYDSKRRYGKETRERVLNWNRAWKANNPDRVSSYQKQYLRDNPEYFVRAVHKRNALKQQLPSTLTVEQWDEIKIRFESKCAYCGKEEPLTQDHFMPLSKGGEYSHNNIIPACKSCNSSKHDKGFFDWYPKFRHYSKKREKAIVDYLNYHNGVQQLVLL